jgi:AAA family ATP:ADP antiporter
MLTQVPPVEGANSPHADLLDRWLGLRPRDHRDAAIAFLTLLLAMAAHAVLETARDTLFLMAFPTRLLPWAYLAIALLALVTSILHRRVLSRLPRQQVLSLTLLLGALVTALFVHFSSLHDSLASLIAFYVWTGLLATLVVVQFWLLVGEILDFGQAKRAFAFIGAGGVAGAAIGSLLASSVLAFAPAQRLPWFASALLVAAAAAPLFLSRASTHAERTRRSSFRVPETLKELGGDPYLRRVLTLVLLGSITVTVADYIFKSIVVREVPRERLGMIFGYYYAVLNVLALGVQLLLAPRLLRVLGIHRVVQTMPLLLVCACLGFVATGGFWAVLLLKGMDGTLRHSLNRVAGEILYLPLGSPLRDRFRTLTEALGLRMGQAVGSVFVLSAATLEIGPEALGWAAAGLAGAWLAATIGLEPVYVKRFRLELRRGNLQRRVQIPELDSRSVEILTAALASADDAEVLIALEVFTAHDKAAFIPAHILDHLSPVVLTRACEAMSQAKRHDLHEPVARLLTHADTEVRAAALQLYTSLKPDVEFLKRMLRDESAAIRATAVVGLIREQAVSDTDARHAIEALLAESVDGRLTLAHTLTALPMPEYAWVASALVESGDHQVAAVAARSIAAAPHSALVGASIRLLAFREARAASRKALVAIGTPALDALEQTLCDIQSPPEERLHVPRTLSLFAGTRPIVILESAFSREPDDNVAFKILRGLGRLRAEHPELPINRMLLEQLARDELSRVMTMTGWRSFLSSARRRAGAPSTTGSELLSAALCDQAERALIRAFRLLHIIEPENDMDLLHRAVTSRDRDMRARGRELLEHVAPERLRDRLLRAVDARLPSGSATHEAPAPLNLTRLDAALAFDEARQSTTHSQSLAAELVASVRQLLLDESRVVRRVAAYHLSELQGIDPAASEPRVTRQQDGVTKPIPRTPSVARKAANNGP